ncbi:MAG: Gfo/Idh/MocA family oxidoreductase [Ilumatobacteraceae bacterium]
MTIRVGFLGTGFISRTHNYFLKHSRVDHRIVAVHDPEAERAQAFADRVGAEAVSEDDVLDRVDAVFVTTWTSEHRRLVAAAADRGLAVFCEKPLAVDAPTAAAMAETVETAGVVNQVGLVLRFVPQFLHARALLADPRAGKLLAVSFRDDQFIPIQSHYGSTWRVDPARAGRGTLLEHSIHDIDILQWLCGDVQTASGVVRETHGYARIDDVTVARLEFVDGGIASLTSIWHDMTDRPSGRQIEVFCDNLYMSFDGTPDGPLTWQFTGEPAQTLQGLDLARACSDSDGMPASSSDDIVIVPNGAIFNPLTPFLAALRDGAPSPLPFTEALPAHRLVDAIYASADRGGAPITAV